MDDGRKQMNVAVLYKPRIWWRLTPRALRALMSTEVTVARSAQRLTINSVLQYKDGS